MSTTDPALRALELARELGYDLVNDHRGIPYDVIERVDEIATALAAAEAAPPTATDPDGVIGRGMKVEAHSAEAAPLDVDDVLRELDAVIKTVDDNIHDPLGGVIKRQLRSARTHVAALAATSREMTSAEHGPCDYNGGPGSDQCPHGVFLAATSREDPA